MNSDFDETILDNEEEFNKRFKIINRKDRPNIAIDKSSQEIFDVFIERLLQDKNTLRRLKAELEKI